MTWETDFAKVLSRVIGRKESEVFKEPVQYIELNIPDYPDIVKQPMDLGTVSTCLSIYLHTNLIFI